MQDRITDFILQRAKDHESFPDDYFPVNTKNPVVSDTDNSNHYKDLGVKEGTLLFFDRSKRFKNGVPSLFINMNTGATEMLRAPKYGYSFAGALVATLSTIEGD